MKTYEAVAKLLAQNTVRTMFGLIGDANLAYLGAFIEHENGEFVAAASEGAAVSMADGFHRMSDRIGVASVTHGPAVTNCLTALTEAVRARSKVLLLTADTPAVHDHFQYLDLEGFARTAGAQYRRVQRADDIAGDLAQALTLIHAEHRPLLLNIPYDLLELDAGSTKRLSIVEPRTGGSLPDADAVDDALGYLLHANRPVVLAGRGALGARAEILRLARMIGAPVLTTLLGKDLFSGEPENLGIYGTLSSEVAAKEISRCDCVLAFGASLNSLTTDSRALLRDKVVIQCDIRPDAIGRFGPVDAAVIADSAMIAQAMCDRLEQTDLAAPTRNRVIGLSTEVSATDQEPYRSITRNGAVDVRDAMTWLAEALPAGTRVVSDIGRFSFTAWSALPVTPGRFAVAGTFGSIGLGIATAIGGAAAGTEVPTVCLAGDGGAMMGIAELSTAVRHKLPLIVVILNDRCYGAEYQKLVDLDLDPAHSEVAWPEFESLGEAFGAHAVQVRSEADFAVAATCIQERQFPLVIEIKLDPARRASFSS